MRTHQPIVSDELRRLALLRLRYAALFDAGRFVDAAPVYAEILRLEVQYCHVKE